MNSLTFKQQKYLGIFFMFTCFITFLYGMKVSNTFILTIAVGVAIYYITFIHIIKERLFDNSLYVVYLLYIFYIAIHFVYGLFNAHTYWHYKNLVSTIIILLVPLFALLFSNPLTNIGILSTWKNILDPKYILIFVFTLAITRFHMIFGPDYFLFGVFIFWLPPKWRLIIGCILCAMLLTSLEGRSQILKALFTIFLASAIFFRQYIPIYLVHVGHWLFYSLAILLVVLGFSGVYNVLNPDFFETEYSLKANQVYGQDEMLQENDFTADTRTSLYIEVVTSAINNDYVIFGRSPARGNDTEYFANEDIYGEYQERSRNEFCHLNIFTWIGLVGMLVYSFFYVQASFLGLYKTKNIYIKYLSLLIAFHWAYGWIEDACEFNMMNIAIWMIIGICLSPKFRSMSEREFELWFKSIFEDGPVTPYHRYVLGKEISACKYIDNNEKVIVETSL